MTTKIIGLRRHVFFISLLLWISLPLKADELSEFSQQVKGALEYGTACEKVLIRQGKGALKASSCQSFIRLSQRLGKTQKAMNIRFQRLDRRMKQGVTCKKTCKERLDNVEIEFTRLRYLLDYFEYTRIYP